MKKCKVVGRNAVDGVPTGGTVELEDYDADRLIAGGHVVAIATQSKKASNTESKEDD